MNVQKPQPKSGTELLLRNLGMGEILDAAKALADNGTLQKILIFADHAEALVTQVRELNENVTAMRAELAAFVAAGRTDEPGTSGSDSGHVEHSVRSVPMPDGNRDVRSEQAGRDSPSFDGADTGDLRDMAPDASAA